jgi:L-lactate dehydrogenase complex protein LldG
VSEQLSMGERDNILGRIREALRAPASRPGSHGTSSQHLNRTSIGSEHARKWLPAVGATSQEQLALFQKMALDLKAHFVSVKSEDELANAIKTLARAENWKKIGLHSGALAGIADRSLDLPKCWTDRPYETIDLESCHVGISECDALIAQTGSVLVTNRSAGGRALSVLPPHHVVLARAAQLVPDLPEAFALLKRKYAPDYPSFISLITGPSRTGDIERILVLGAHGPRKLTILLLQ